MGEVFRLVLALSLSGSVLYLALAALRPLLRNTLPRSWQYYLWVIVLLRLAIPYTPPVGPIHGFWQDGGRAAVQEATVSVPDTQQTVGPVLQPAPASGSAVTPAAPELAQRPSSHSTPRPNGMTLLGYGWAAGALLLLCWKSTRYALYAGKMRRTSHPVTDGGIVKQYEEAASVLRIKRLPELRADAGIESPMLLGLFRPAVLLPETELFSGDAGLPYVLRHELTHLKRRDILYKWLAELVLCVHWFNPLVYRMTGQITRACELSCDEAVAGRLGAEEKLLYGRALLNAAEHTAHRRRLLSVGLQEDKISIKERLRTILKTGKHSKASVIISAFLAATLCLSAVLLGACSAGTAGSARTPAVTPSASASPSPSPSASAPEPSADGAKDEQDVRTLVTDFGKVLKNVSLLAPEDDLVKSIKDNYTPYLTSDLLESWLTNPSVRAAGRVASSPWPDRIEIKSIQKNDDGSYSVIGTIVEVTSTEAQNGTAADTRSLTVKAVQSGGKWLISEFTAGAAVMSNGVTYSNTTYGFDFSLPADWKGYKVVNDQWKGTPVGDASQPGITGPEIILRSPKWTKDNPTQDIPIMVFTLDQYNDVVQEKYAVSAAPIPPSELGRNSKYVFALPPRYNFAFPPGYEEVDKIIQGNPLKANENFK